MLSISNIGAHQASTYYKKDDYYAREGQTDFWQGNLKDELKLPDQVKPEDFNALIGPRKERAGFDLAFSAPKSVSVAALCTDEPTRQAMLEAHNTAVRETLELIEQQQIGTRITQDKQVEHIKTGNMIAAKFEHYVSRNSDPQLHTHAVILNKTQYDGKWYAVDNPDLYRNAIHYGQLYRNTLAQELMAKGYEITVTDPEKGFFELKGIDHQIVDEFSSRRKEIVEKLKEWGINTPEAAERAALLTRKAKKEKSMDILQESWRETIRGMGAGELTLTKSDTPITLTPDQQKVEFDQAIARLSRRQFAFTEKELKRAVLAAGVGSGMNEADYDRLKAEYLGMKHLIGLGGIKGSDDPTVYYTTRQSLEAEKQIFHSVSRGKNTMPGMDTEKAKQLLITYLDRDKAPLSEEQFAAAVTIATTKDKHVAVQGLAGTGKTFMLNYARQVMESDGYTVLGACFTGKAAQGLEDDAKIPSGTIHSFLNRLEREAGNRKPGEDMHDKTEWNLTGLKPGQTKEAWIVDEASMVDNVIMKQLLEAAELKNAKVVLVGDRQQLLPVGVGNAFAVLTEKDKIHTVTIEDIRRQKDNAELLQAVREAVKGDLNKSLELIEKQTISIAKHKDRMNAIVADFTTLTPEQQRETVVLTASNKDRRKLNEGIRAELKSQGQLQPGAEFKVEDSNGKNHKREFSLNDRIIFLQNDIRLGIKNGQVGTIEKMDGTVLDIKSGDEKSGYKTLTIDLDLYKKIDHGYAMTVHKAQGITVDRVLINLDSSQKHLNSRNAYYVDISRARHEVKVYADSVEKIVPQISEFAKKITSENFELTNAPKAPEPKAPEPQPQKESEFTRMMNSLADDCLKGWGLRREKEDPTPTAPQIPTPTAPGTPSPTPTPSPAAPAPTIKKGGLSF